MTTYRAVLVGCGPRGARHAQAILAHPEHFVLAAICDIDRTRLTACAAEFGMTTTYTDAETMLTTERPDVLCFATMPHIRLPLVELGITHGVRAMACEKPLALSLSEAKRIVDRCTVAGIKLIVCHQWKFSALWRQTYEIVRSGDLGEVHTIHASSRPSMLRAGTHLLDTMLWLNNGHQGAWVLGQAHGVAAYDEDHPCPDHLTGLVQFTNGVRGILECGTLAPHLLEDDNFWEDCGVTVYGTHGYVRTVLGTGWQALTCTSGGALLSGPLDPTPQEPAYMQALANWLDDPQQVHPSNGAVSYTGFELLMGMVLSSVERRKVEIPIEVIPERPELPRLKEALLMVGTV
jgi:predicted dehydrogenase